MNTTPTVAAAQIDLSAQSLIQLGWMHAVDASKTSSDPMLESLQPAERIEAQRYFHSTEAIGRCVIALMKAAEESRPQQMEFDEHVYGDGIAAALEHTFKSITEAVTRQDLPIAAGAKIKNIIATAIYESIEKYIELPTVTN